MNEPRRVGTALAAVAAMAVVVVGVPALLVVLVGNPWPGKARVELRDEVALGVGILAVLAWLVWARFVLSIVVELHAQVGALRRAARRDPSGRVVLTPPAASHSGVGLLAQRLVAAALIILPLATKAVPAVAEAPASLRSERSALVVSTPPAPQTVEAPRPTAPTSATGGSVTVAPGDTLISLARTNLGDGERWREIFELNRERPQVDGGRLLSPSAIRTGWTLVLPAGAATPQEAPSDPVAETASHLAEETVTIDVGDNLWDLSHEQLEKAAAAHDDASVAAYLREVIAANPEVIEDPNLIYAGEQFAFPAIGTPPAPPPSPAPEAPVEPAATPAVPAPEPAPTDEPQVVPTTVAPDAAVVTTSTTTPTPGPPTNPAPVGAETSASASPSPIGIGEAALLSAGVLALLASRRRLRLRSSQPRARVPEPPPETVATERRLRAVDAGERLLRVDVAVRAAAAALVEGAVQIAVVRAGVDGAVELTLTGDAVLPPPWEGAGSRWQLPGSMPVELLADAARSVGAPCVALAQLGVDDEGREVLVDLEALGVLSIAAPEELADAVVRGVGATLATSVFAEVANLIGVGIDETSFLDHRHAHYADSVDDAVELAATLVGSTSSAKQSTFVLRSRHTSGEAWEPAIVLTGAAVAAELTPELVRSMSRRRGGVAMVVAGDAAGAPWSLRADGARWTLAPLGICLTPVGLSADELSEIHEVLQRADERLVPDDSSIDDAGGGEVGSPVTDELLDPPWSLLVRLLGPVEVVDRAERAIRFERSKTLELIAWLTLHRDGSTRAGARTALWELDVRDATFANVVSEARRAMARHIEPPDGEEWLGRTLTEVLPLHEAVVSDVDLVRARLDHARVQPPELAIETLRPAVELIRDMPFSGTGYLWPDAEGIASNLVLLATSAATELAGHFLSMGDVDGVFWATGQGLKVLAGHEELIALRMRAHARAGDLSGVRLEWESYERVLNADPWGDGEPAPKLVMLRRELLSS